MWNNQNLPGDECLHKKGKNQRINLTGINRIIEHINWNENFWPIRLHLQLHIFQHSLSAVFQVLKQMQIAIKSSLEIHHRRKNHHLVTVFIISRICDRKWNNNRVAGGSYNTKQILSLIMKPGWYKVWIQVKSREISSHKQLNCND